MNLKALATTVSSTVGRQLLKGQKHSPTILFAGGVVGVITTTVLAARATLKLEEVLDHSAKNRELADDLLSQNRKDYTADDHQKDVAYIKVKTAVNIAKLYGPTVILGLVSIGALAGSHNILSKRNAALTAAYGAMKKGFDEYRKRVVDELGEDKDREFRYGSESREIVEETETGPQTRTVQRAKHGSSIYARLFGQDSSNSWSPTPEYNLLFLKSQQNMANDQLRARGHVFLNEVYDSLGLERSKEGAIVGWVWDNGDGYIDFGIFDRQMTPQALDFFTGHEGQILLDFNVDGVIYDKI